MVVVCLLSNHLIHPVYDNVKQMLVLSYRTSLTPRHSNKKDWARKKEKGFVMVLDVEQTK